MIFNNPKKGDNMAIEYVKSGIPGLDKVLKGGFRKNSTILITGSPGTGKTIMALQFIYYGAKTYNEPGIFITLEENLDDIRVNGKNLGMDIMLLEKKGKIFFFQKPVSMLKGGLISIKGLLDLIKKNKIKRVALDSMMLFEYLYPDHDNKMEFRRHIIMLLEQLKKAGITFIAVSERKITDLDRLEYDMMDFVFEGFIILSRVRKGSFFERVLTVAKIRGQNHSMDVYPISIEDKKGLSVLADQTPFSMVEKENSNMQFK